MSERLINFSKPFIEATRNVYETMLFSPVKHLSPSIKKTKETKGDISTILGVKGKINHSKPLRKYQAQLILSWPYDSYLKTASAMLMETYQEFSNEISDVGSEICNIIMGNAKKELTLLNYETSMEIPTLMSEKCHDLKYIEGGMTILVPFESKHGDFFMELCYKEEDDEKA